MSIVLADTVRIPAWVKNLSSFRRWARSPDLPSHGWFSHLKGDLWVDLSMETADHNQAKGETDSVLTFLVKQERRGHFFHDRMLLTHVEAELSTEPDGTFVSYESLRAGRARLIEGPKSLEIEGSPDMTLEVVSSTSVVKDTEVLPDLYWRAEVREYWLVNPIGQQLTFDIFRHTARGYVVARKQAGWVRSAVFGKSFRLTRSIDEAGLPMFRLDVR